MLAAASVWPLCNLQPLTMGHCCRAVQVNVDVLSVVPSGRQLDTLLYQLMCMRLCLDEVTAQYQADQAVSANLGAAGQLAAVPAVPAGADDGAAALQARLRLRGRDRHPPSPVVL